MSLRDEAFGCETSASKGQHKKSEWYRRVWGSACVRVCACVCV